jgi:hypothetical protein
VPAIPWGVKTMLGAVVECQEIQVSYSAMLTENTAAITAATTSTTFIANYCNHFLPMIMCSNALK